eukprot:TRINITY_DN7846_c0_g1_i8.p1 TRINITY_DN7846_c0_g1~~TRINITY_DN7846_c0_g1_i8.p1  ORF type:complete len:189 (-),score=41.78 TRINITY_DN7846_c0_g1_i8:429-995(-)
MRRSSTLKKVQVTLPNEECTEPLQWKCGKDKENMPRQLTRREEELLPFSKNEERESLSQSDEDDIQRVVEETKRREDRLKQQLASLKEQALAAIAGTPNKEKSQLENCQLRNRLDKYQLELSSVKETMENILHFTKQTHNEVQRTKDMVSSINDLTPNKCGSFKDNFEDDYGEGPEYSAIEGPIRINL